MAFPHHDTLVMESVHILHGRSPYPVMTYFVGKGGSALLRLLFKVLHPARPPTPMLHVDALLVSIDRKLPERIGLACYRREEEN